MSHHLHPFPNHLNIPHPQNMLPIPARPPPPPVISRGGHEILSRRLSDGGGEQYMSHAQAQVQSVITGAGGVMMPHQQSQNHPYVETELYYARSRVNPPLMNSQAQNVPTASPFVMNNNNPGNNGNNNHNNIGQLEPDPSDKDLEKRCQSVGNMMKNAYNQYVSVVHDMRERVASSCRAQAEMAQQIAELKSSLDKQKDEINKLEGNIIVLDDERSTMTERYRQKESKIVDLEKSVTGMMKDVHRLQTEKSNLQNDNKSLQDDYNNCKSQYDDLNHLMSGIETASAEREREYDKLKAANDALERRKRQLKAEKVEMEKQHQLQKEQIERKYNDQLKKKSWDLLNEQNEKTRYKGNYDRLKIEFDGQNDKLNAKAKEAREYEEDLAKTKKEKEALSKSLESEREKVKKFEDLCGKVVTENSELKAAVSLHQTETEMFKQKSDKLETDVEDLKNQLQNSELTRRKLIQEFKSKFEIEQASERNRFNDWYENAMGGDLNRGEVDAAHASTSNTTPKIKYGGRHRRRNRNIVGMIGANRAGVYGRVKSVVGHMIPKKKARKSDDEMLDPSAATTKVTGERAPEPMDDDREEESAVTTSTNSPTCEEAQKSQTRSPARSSDSEIIKDNHPPAVVVNRVHTPVVVSDKTITSSGKSTPPAPVTVVPSQISPSNNTKNGPFSSTPRKTPSGNIMTTSPNPGTRYSSRLLQNLTPSSNSQPGESTCTLCNVTFASKVENAKHTCLKIVKPSQIQQANKK